MKKYLTLLILCMTLSAAAKPVRNFQFSQFGYQWTTDSGAAPGVGTFSPARVAIGSGIRLTLAGTNGAEVRTVNRYLYGTFQWTETVSLVESGQVSAGFLYYNNSQTEIDFERTGDLPDTLWVSNYAGVSNEVYSEVCCYAATATHTMKMVWKPGEVDYYVDGALVAVHTQYVPSTAAYFIFNFWGTNSVDWGGLATPGTRYYTISNFTYIALGGA